MKKLPYIFLAVIGIVSAQGVQAQEREELSVMREAKEVKNLKFRAIEIVELPMAIQDKAAVDFENFRIKEAYISENELYKIVLVNKDNFTQVVFASAKGEWIKPNDKS
ncbi:hypothetical protein [Aquimarina intermedia]|uniref:Uncharacterized protein n=1 Tax=Aquimarina intermedia TaxID=350814 RepID=A0A5S5CFQ2_9FLAO|nr:hypothetical protein [Aquimarina intermedia]TYP77126.1 hypothetical protein BD809_101274 [Aquimarina intermedia]